MRKRILLLGLLVTLGLAGYLWATHHHEEVLANVLISDPEYGFAFQELEWLHGREEETELLLHVPSSISHFDDGGTFLDFSPETMRLVRPGDSIIICFREIRMPYSDMMLSQTRARLEGSDEWVVCGRNAEALPLAAFVGLLMTPLFICFMLALWVRRGPTEPETPTPPD